VSLKPRARKRSQARPAPGVGFLFAIFCRPPVSIGGLRGGAGSGVSQ
jgi:hypothetical protein